MKVKVTAHHEELLVQAAGVSELQGSLTHVRSGLEELDSSIEKYVHRQSSPRCVYTVLNMISGSDSRSGSPIKHSRPTCSDLRNYTKPPTSFVEQLDSSFWHGGWRLRWPISTGSRTMTPTNPMPYLSSMVRKTRKRGRLLKQLLPSPS
jgi:hypothetical protein